MNLRSLMIATAALSAIAGAAAAQSTATNTVPAYVNFVAPVSVTAGNQMQFGTFTLPTTAGGSIVLTTAGDATATGGGVTELSSSAPAAATFTLTAQPTTNVSLAVVSEAVTSGYTLGTFTVSGDTGCTGATTASAFTFSSGSCTLSVGATLDLPASASAGQVQVGTVRATLSYQ